MESIKESLCTLTEMFNTKMNDFQQELNKNTSPVSNHSLPTEFNNFRSFILSVLNTIQRQVECLTLELDRQVMKKRYKTVLFHGVAEQKEENISERITGLVAEHLDLPNFSSASIKDCHRLGRYFDKPRPIVVKFCDISVRNKVWFAKTKLKGTGVTQSEFLTTSRHETFMAARQRFGISKCWTRDGMIYIVTPDGTRHRVECKSDLNAITNQIKSPPQRLPATVVPKNIEKVPTLRAKRVAKK